MIQVSDQAALGNLGTPGAPPPRTNQSSRECSDGQRLEQDQARYRELRNELEKAGCFRPAPWAYIFRIAWIVAVYALGYAVLLSQPDPALRLGMLLVVAFATVQAGFVAHEAGDGSVTSNRRVSFALRQVLMSFVSAMSSTYFHSLHRVHHRTLHKGSSVRADGSRPVNSYEGKALKRLVSGNGLLFLCVTVLLRGFSLRLEGLRYVLRHLKTTKSDQLFMAAHAIVWLVLPLLFVGVADTMINYALVALFAGPYVGTVLILNHEGMQAARSMDHVPVMERITSTTRNLGNSRWEEFLLGGVNNHIEHHLFPGIPVARLRHARTITRDFFKRHGIAFSETSYLRALAETVHYFRGLSPGRLASEYLA